MSALVVLFNLKSGVNSVAYEEWARTVDLPTVRRLTNCARYDVFKSIGRLGSDAPPPYQYVEFIELVDYDKFLMEIGETKMQEVAAQFHTFAEAPIFIHVDAL